MPPASRRKPASPEKQKAEPATEGPWLMLIYRVPSGSSKARVAVWRELKRLGGLYVQQAVCVLPDRAELRESMDKVRKRIDELDGSSLFLTLRDVEDEARVQFVDGFRGQSAKEYAEIVEECETKFFKEIEFERFRNNYTFEEAEEIRQDLEKLRRWLAKAIARDWMAADGRELAERKVEECEQLLEEFESDVYERTVNNP
jgi:ChrB-like protein